MKRWSVCALVVGCLVLLAGPALAGKRVALVIGNSAYEHASKLDNPAKDARLMADTLRALGFTLVRDAALTDLDKAGLEAAIQDFGNQITGAEAALFFYAGHAVQLRGSNYLVPINANPAKDADADLQMDDAGFVLHQMEGTGTRLNLVILDACHDNPFEGKGLRLSSSGLAPMKAPERTLISFAAQPGRVGRDGTDGESAYTRALVQALQRPGPGVFDVFNEVGLAVEHATGDAQLPFVSFSAIDANFAFALPATSADRSNAGEAALSWVAARDTTNVAAIETFIQHYPDTFYADLARARLNELAHPAQKPAQVAIVPPPAPDSSGQPSSVVGSRPRAVLYEEDPSDPKGRQFVGSVIWRTEQVKPAGAQKAELAVHADIEIPARNLKMTLTLRRNTDAALPASHTIDLAVTVPPGFSGGGINNIPGILMKSNEQARGTPLAALAVKVADGVFLVGLSNVDTDRARNLQTLKEREWLDVPMIYGNQRRGIMAIEKGPSGDRAFEAALSSWGQMR
jgi:Caspase domain